MRDVLAWVAAPDDAAGAVSRFLRRSPEPAYESDALQFLTTNDRTQSSICATIMPALGLLTDSTAARAAVEGGSTSRSCWPSTAPSTCSVLRKPKSPRW